MLNQWPGLTKLAKLDRRSMILLQVAQYQTEMGEKDTSHDFEELVLLGGFGAIGGIIRRLQRRENIVSRASSNPHRVPLPGAIDPLTRLMWYQL